MLNLLAWLAGVFYAKKPHVEILCVHGKKSFHRNEIASRLFRERLKSYSTGTIVCSPSALVPILSSLVIDLPDGMKWWGNTRKISFAKDCLTKDMPEVELAQDATGVKTKLVWIDGGSLIRGYVPDGSVVFTGAINDDPFVRLDRTTFIPGVDGGHSYHTNAGEFCSSWHVK